MEFSQQICCYIKRHSDIRVFFVQNNCPDLRVFITSYVLMIYVNYMENNGGDER